MISSLMAIDILIKINAYEYIKMIISFIRTVVYTTILIKTTTSYYYLTFINIMFHVEQFYLNYVLS